MIKTRDHLTYSQTIKTIQMKSVLAILVALFVTTTSFSQAPANDLCGNAIEITDLDGSCNGFTNVNATATNPFYPTCFSTGGGGSQEPLVWFTFTAEGPNATITVTNTDGTNNFNPEIAVIGFPLGEDGDLCDINDVVQYACSNPNGNYSSLTLNINNNVLVPGVEYLIAVNTNNSGAFDLCIDNPVNDSPSTCANAQPFCTADGSVVYDAGVDDGIAEPGNAYDCLITQPNPAWFFLEIDEPGDMEITMTSTPAEDIDYVLWGPFTSQADGCGQLTSANVVDCSFLAATTEVANITGAQSGEVYILLITNFSNRETEITFEQTDGAASTNCAIVLPIDLIAFEAESYHSTVNIITWSTASERNNDFFTVEHSSDGVTWREIAYIPGAGNTAFENRYSYQHSSFSETINYYRLRQTDFDGTEEVFQVVAVDNRMEKQVLKEVNALGQEIDATYRGVVFRVYDDGTREKIHR
jgi:hypothetical protein